MKYFISLLSLLVLSLVSISSLALDNTACWVAPTQLENGTPLAITDIGGFKLVYQKTTDTTSKEVTIPSGTATCYTFTDLDSVSTYNVQIAAFTKTGLFSNFVAISYKVASPPKAPTGLKITQKVYDVVAACLAAAPNCKVAVAGEWL